MTYRITVCDDNQKDADELDTLIQNWGKAHGFSIQVHTFPSAEAYLFSEELPDILLLDVEMKTLSGIDLAKKIRRENRQMEIIFVTSHVEFIGEGYEVDALHYLIKPVNRTKLFSALDKAVLKLSQSPKFVVIHTDGETIRLTEDDILYVEAFSHDVSVHTKERQYEVKEGISSFEARLSSRFFRVHRSYLVSLTAIVRISRSSVTLCNGEKLPLSRGRYDAVNRAFIDAN